MQFDGLGSMDMDAELLQEIKNFYVSEVPAELDGLGSTGMDAELLQDIQNFYKRYPIRPPAFI